MQRKRSGGRPWLFPLVIVVLFIIALIAATSHISSIPRAFESVFGGTVNFGSKMILEVLMACCFLVLAIIDLIMTAARKSSPYVLRIITAIVSVVCIILMGTAYIDVYGCPVWCNAPATIILFAGGDLAMGLALFALMDASARYDESALRVSTIVIQIVLALGICLEIASFAGNGLDFIAQIAGLIIAPVLCLILVATASKFKNQKVLAACVFIACLIGVAISRYAFYAACVAL